MAETTHMNVRNEEMEAVEEEEEDSWIPLTPPGQQKFASHSIGENHNRPVDDSKSVSTTKTSWYHGLALFGDSSVALAMSGLLLLVALATSAFLEGNLPFTENLSPEEIAYRALGPTPIIASSTIYEMFPTSTQQLLTLSEEMILAFERDGVIAIRGLLDANTLDALDRASMRLVEEQKQKNQAKTQEKAKIFNGRKSQGSQFYTVRQNAIFLPSDNENTTSPFVEVAMMSAIPKLAASLLQSQQSPETCTNETVRILRDIFLAKDEDQYICGWHVDDIGFWPALADAPGVNAWIALDNMPIENGGGFALAVGSHKAPWRYDAYELTGSTHSFPEGGFTSSKDILHNRPGNGTCNIKDAAPHLQRRMEETKRIYDIKRGDVIFHDRWLFHRTVPFQRDPVSDRIVNNDEPLVFRRYSVRYGPGSSIIPPGYGTEPSVISLAENGGKSADNVARDDAAWYPKVFPSVDVAELHSMKVLAMERLPAAMEKSEDRKRRIRPRRTRQH
ncbi:phytanoyl-CoA dioxygenase family protein [Nitzschia inconspicua]|uniref:Phytanoyl-CoA dioxygenase family protein n=1 Tax=Nitzschia inconspicua TaxID=303405 RepID=A0A9K3LLJ3_9STRA|nr:phytanoyl-CoA dioxygenase family protein [Nitzschia inconspicua]